MTEATGEDRILTVPNGVTVVRLGLLPLFIYLLLIHQPPERYTAALILAVMGATDWVDGYLARHLHQVSTAGKILDPIADRLLLIGGVTAIVIDGSVPVWVAVVALCASVPPARALLGWLVAFRGWRQRTRWRATQAVFDREVGAKWTQVSA